jgi:hypothetical protein
MRRMRFSLDITLTNEGEKETIKRLAWLIQDGLEYNASKSPEFCKMFYVGNLHVLRHAYPIARFFRGKKKQKQKKE